MLTYLVHGKVLVTIMAGSGIILYNNDNNNTQIIIIMIYLSDTVLRPIFYIQGS